MESEAFVFWALVGAVRARAHDGELTAEFLAEVRDELIGMSQNTDWPALRRRCGRAIMDFAKLRAEVAA